MSSSATSSRTAVRTPSRSPRDSRRFHARSSNTAAHASRKWTPTRSSGAGRERSVVDEFPHSNVPGSGRDKRLGRRARPARRGHRRADDDERAASREPERSDMAEHRRARARDDPGLGAEGGRRSRDGGSHPGRADQQTEARRRVSRPTRPRKRWRTSSASRHWSRYASSRCGKPRTPSKAASTEESAGAREPAGAIFSQPPSASCS